MSLSKVWDKYNDELKTINHNLQRNAILEFLFAASTAMTNHFNIAHDNKINTIILSTLTILFGCIAVYVFLLLIICSRKGNKLQDWLEENYKCPHCGSYFGDGPSHTLNDKCGSCDKSIKTSMSISVTNLNLNLNRWVFVSRLICISLALLLIGLSYFYPYSILNLNLNPNPAIRMLANDMVFVQGGKLDIGATKEQKPDTFPDEFPAHQIDVSDFYICKHEVTQYLWEEVMGINNNPSNNKGDRFPVENVSYFKCLEFIEKLNKMTGKKYRLPTEEEWEYAARGGQKSKHFKYAGSHNVEDVAWYEKNSGNAVHEVCSKDPNELDLYDMSGNVLEWCQSFYTENYEDISSPKTSKEGDTLFVLRGGSFISDEARRVRVAYRDYAHRRRQGDGVGLRLVRE